MAKLLDAPYVEYKLITRSEHYATVYYEPESGCLTTDLLAKAFQEGQAGLDTERGRAIAWVDAAWFAQHHTHPPF